VAWNSAGTIGYLSLVPWAGTSVHPTTAPALVRVRVNSHPPPGLYYSLRSRKFIAALLLLPEAAIAEGPKLEVVATLAQLGVIGKWLPEWLSQQASGSHVAPKLPCAVNSKEAEYDFAGDDGRWRAHEVLWTKEAADLASAWYAKRGD